MSDLAGQGLDERAAAVAQRFQVPVIVAALAVIPAIVIERSDLGGRWEAAAFALNWGSWLVFAAEIVTMTILASPSRAWLRNNMFDVAITVVTFPLVPALLQGLRLLRLARLARALRLLRLVRAGRVSQRLFTPAGLGWTAAVVLFSIVVAAEAFIATESQQDLSVWDGLWWAVTTTTTVGYGDVYPETGAGRAIAVGLMVVGIGFVAMLTAAVAQRWLLPRTDAPRASESASGTVEDLAQEIAAIREQLTRIEASLTEHHASTRQSVLRDNVHHGPESQDHHRT